MIYSARGKDTVRVRCDNVGCGWLGMVAKLMPPDPAYACPKCHHLKITLVNQKDVTMKKDPIVQPSKHDVAKLLKELEPGWRLWSDELTKLELAEAELQEKLLQNPALVKLRAQIKVVIDELDRKRDQTRKKLCKVRRLFFANGPTQQVVRMLNELIEEGYVSAT